MGGLWWFSPELDELEPDLTIEGEHRITRGDHYGTVQTRCALCTEAAAKRALVVDGQLSIELGACYRDELVETFCTTHEAFMPAHASTCTAVT